MEFSWGFKWYSLWHLGVWASLVDLSPCHFHSGGEKYTAKKLFCQVPFVHTPAYFLKDQYFADLLKFALLMILMMLLGKLKFQAIDH